MDYFAHQSAYIDENVSIGEGTKIWHFCHIMPHTIIGKHCSFGQNCVVGPNAKIGNNVYFCVKTIFRKFRISPLFILLEIE